MGVSPKTQRFLPVQGLMLSLLGLGFLHICPHVNEILRVFLFLSGSLQAFQSWRGRNLKAAQSLKAQKSAIERPFLPL